MPSLSEVVADPAKRRRVVDDGVAMIEAEVADKGGLSGMAIKGAFAMVQKMRPGFVGGALNHLLDDFAKQVDPFWAECREKKEEPRAFFVRRGNDVANALLSITDMRARGASGPVRSTYDKLRPQASEHVKAAMPRLADLLKKHAS
jgi:hypothetical protein